MNEIASFFSLSRLVDAIIALTVIEGAALVAYHRMTGRGIAPRDFLLNLLSGLSLMFALRYALVNADWPWVPVCVGAAGLAHACDMGQRWARQRRRF